MKPHEKKIREIIKKVFNKPYKGTWLEKKPLSLHAKKQVEEISQVFLDWHNKQLSEVVEKLETRFGAVVIPRATRSLEYSDGFGDALGTFKPLVMNYLKSLLNEKEDER